MYCVFSDSVILRHVCVVFRESVVCSTSRVLARSWKARLVDVSRTFSNDLEARDVTFLPRDWRERYARVYTR